MKRQAIWKKQTISDTTLCTGFLMVITMIAELTAKAAKRKKNIVSIIILNPVYF
jgi:hypothetical protein